MDLHLTFAQGRMTGDGTDDIGRFLINGGYNSANGECWWTKTYPGSHEVFYHGFRDGFGIWGGWDIPPLAKGGFHIWPRRAGNGAHEAQKEQLEEPVETVAVEAAGDCTLLIAPEILTRWN